MFGGAADDEVVAIADLALFGDGDGPGSGQELSSRRLWAGSDFGWSAGSDDLSALATSAWAEVDDEVGGTDGV